MLALLSMTGAERSCSLTAGALAALLGCVAVTAAASTTVRAVPDDDAEEEAALRFRGWVEGGATAGKQKEREVGGREWFGRSSH
jgi:hypothetical protein